MSTVLTLTTGEVITGRALEVVASGVITRAPDGYPSDLPMGTFFPWHMVREVFTTLLDMEVLRS